MRKELQSKKLIGTMEVAGKLGCHPMSVPRLVRGRRGFPQPNKLFNKNLWEEGVVDAYIAELLATKQREA